MEHAHTQPLAIAASTTAEEHGPHLHHAAAIPCVLSLETLTISKITPSMLSSAGVGRKASVYMRNAAQPLKGNSLTALNRAHNPLEKLTKLTRTHHVLNSSPMPGERGIRRQG